MRKTFSITPHLRRMPSASGNFAENSLLWMEFYPFNADLSSLWLFLLGGTDGAAVLAGAFWVVLFGISGGMLVRALGGSRASAMLTAALLVGSTRRQGGGRRFTSPDLSGAAMFLAAVVFLLPQSGETRRPLLVLAGSLAGWATGSKILFVPSVLVSHCGWSQPQALALLLPAIRLGGVFLAAATVTGSYWYLRALVATGDPVFPGSFGPFHGPFTAWHQWQTSLLGQLVQGDVFSSASLATLSQYLEWPVGLCSLFLGSSGARRRFLAKRHATWRARSDAACACRVSVHGPLPAASVLRNIRYP